MKILEIKGEKVYDSRKKETIRISVKTNLGTFSTSSPSGTSTGKYEVPAFAKNVSDSIAKIDKLASRIKEVNIERFNDLEEIDKRFDLIESEYQKLGQEFQKLLEYFKKNWIKAKKYDKLMWNYSKGVFKY